MLEEILSYFAKYQYPGIFLISLISNSIPFVGVPYLNFLLIISSFLSFEDAVLIALISALGASLGKVIIYSIGASMRLTLSKKTKENLQFFEKIFKKWGIFAIFLFAASPLPDDVLYIPLGMAKYKLFYYFIAVFSGKVLVTSYVILMGKFTSDLMREIIDNYVLSFLLFFALTILLTIVVIKIDWKSLFEKYYKV
ncbi:MAG: VTT domain-containing protein [Archaeoglobaceae archaeon]|nr:VTT domain-containing protein [Archaeoglobaceae archaeon]MCX8152406.1 VTT domain-containing protein [Archaeoglobaceae archaeon]MDW8013746.1 VTT domain-containing protein [Archaeoglobaceae archaeon]